MHLKWDTLKYRSFRKVASRHHIDKDELPSVFKNKKWINYKTIVNLIYIDLFL